MAAACTTSERHRRTVSGTAPATATAPSEPTTTGGTTTTTGAARTTSGGATSSTAPRRQPRLARLQQGSARSSAPTLTVPARLREPGPKGTIDLALEAPAGHRPIAARRLAAGEPRRPGRPRHRRSSTQAAAGVQRATCSTASTSSAGTRGAPAARAPSTASTTSTRTSRSTRRPTRRPRSRRSSTPAKEFDASLRGPQRAPPALHLHPGHGARHGRDPPGARRGQDLVLRLLLRQRARRHVRHAVPGARAGHGARRRRRPERRLRREHQATGRRAGARRSHAILDDCAKKTSCAFHHDGNPRRPTTPCMAKLATNPMPSAGRAARGRARASPSTRVVSGLYVKAYWPLVTAGARRRRAGRRLELLALVRQLRRAAAATARWTQLLRGPDRHQLPRRSRARRTRRSPTPTPPSSRTLSPHFGEAGPPTGYNCIYWPVPQKPPLDADRRRRRPDRGGGHDWRPDHPHREHQEHGRRPWRRACSSPWWREQHTGYRLNDCVVRRRRRLPRRPHASRRPAWSAADARRLRDAAGAHWTRAAPAERARPTCPRCHTSCPRSRSPPWMPSLPPAGAVGWRPRNGSGRMPPSTRSLAAGLRGRGRRRLPDGGEVGAPCAPPAAVGATWWPTAPRASRPRSRTGC